ncbi:attractin-like protein 1 isoform X2 [Lineus longissimus]|uniref:attractin-like protein 1 isoform X2 n=1 Tax=Lineus longissimus TaxID=88925 RepID=UPI002B4D4C22
MADDVMLIFQMKSKFRRKIPHLILFFAYFFLFVCLLTLVDSAGLCSPSNCVHGECNNDTCVCSPGWMGKSCDACGGRAKLTSSSGFISDGASNYTVNVKCTWLLDTGRPNSTLRLRLHEFATECGWDHLYIYDGSSVFDPLLAVYSGLIRKKSANDSAPLPEVKATSGRAYLYFYSDAAYNMSGFNISYSVNTCPLNCSNNGVCNNAKGECACHVNFNGPSCDIPNCPHSCAPNGNCVDGKCHCKTGFTGIGCNISSEDGSWSMAPSHPLGPGGRASHKSVIDGTWIYVIGGYDLSMTGQMDISRFHVIDQRWENVRTIGELPAARYGHSVVLYKNKIYMFGGDVLTVNITNELWVFDVPANTATPILPVAWSLINSSSADLLPIGVVGHTAHVVNDTMYVIFGYSSLLGYTNTVQEYRLDDQKWSLAQTTGAIVKGGYAHSSVYDLTTEAFYVHAGYLSGSTNHYVLADTLYSYQPKKRKWTILHSSGQFKYLHSAAMIGDVMLVYGGNPHNDTHKSSGAKCYSSDFMAYDIKCDKWHFLPNPKLPQDVSRFGHTADVYQGKTSRQMYVFGGFNGVMLNDVLVYTPGNCHLYVTEETCLAALPGQSCVWVQDQGCMTKTEAHELIGKSITLDDVSERTCTPHKEDLSDICQYSTCPSCVTTTYQCNWCDSRCSHTKCNKDEVKTLEQCPANVSHNCSMLHQCSACQIEKNCKWGHKEKSCIYVGEGSGIKLDKTYSQTCPPSCEVNTGCEACTNAGCMWCASQGTCVGSNAYVATFPYGQCLEWTTLISKCSDTRCEDARMCEDCLKNPMCGWCSDGSDTGLGKCHQGGDKGPYSKNTGGVMTLNQTMCPNRRWHFTECPVCQCNGHSTCYPGTDTCVNCVDLTQGDKCQECQDWYYGTATNGGNCTMCECNDQADTCDRFSGKCNCRTKGVIGNKCNLCNEEEKYYGNPRGGTCYYNLATDYQFTFNLSKKDDRHLTHINFLNIPHTPDRDVDFSINCSDDAMLNVTVKTKDDPVEHVIISDKRCYFLKAKFSHSQYSFGSEKNTTFFVYIYNFKTPVTVKISFSQFPKIDLIQFFVTFFSCFLSLLLIAALFWKVKQRYDAYIRRQRMIVEMERMVSRPFSKTLLEVRQSTDDSDDKKEPPDIRRRKKLSDHPSAIAIEPLHSQKAAVLSVILQLPTGDEQFPPPNQSGLYIASALVSLGHNRKQSFDKSTDKLKRKYAPRSNMDTCI